MEEYRSNSNKSKNTVAEPVQENTEKRFDKVISADVSVKEKKTHKKIADAIFAEDIRNIGSYVFSEVIIPYFKKAIHDGVTNAIDIMFYGKTNGQRGNGPVQYNQYYQPNTTSYQSNRYQANVYQFKEIEFRDRGTAEMVLDQMIAALQTYGTVKVGDMYDMAGITGSYTDYKYGWTDLRSARVVRDMGNTFYLDLPKALPL